MGYSFAELFKKYRLRAEFEKLSELGNALSEKGLRYEYSLFSHWQKGTRTPTKRNLLIGLIEIFIEHGAITAIKQANELLESVQQGYLTQKEIDQLPAKHLESPPFQVPKDILTFSGRQDTMQSLSQTIKEETVTVIYGSAGVGKTALAIHMGHMLKNQFLDGILWYRIDTSDTADILASIAFSYGENIEHIKDVEIRSSSVRSLLSNKKALLILDNAEQYTDVQMLIPNGSSCSVIITSQYKTLGIPASYKIIPLTVFSESEALNLYQQILGSIYVDSHKQTLIQCTEILGYLPLAISIFAKQIKNSSFSLIELQKKLEKEKIALENFIYQDKSFYASVTLSFKNLSKSTKKLFISLGIFDGKDFSLEAIVNINNISHTSAKIILEELINASLVENSTRNRYRLHPLIKNFVRPKTSNDIYLNGVAYFEKLLQKNSEKNTDANSIQRDLDNIIFIFEQCYKLKWYTQGISLWKYLGNFLYITGDWDRTVSLGKLAYKITKRTKDYTNHVMQSIRILYIVAFWQGDLSFAEKLATESLDISTALHNDLLIALSQQTMSEIYKAKNDFSKALNLLQAALEYFNETNNTKQIYYTLKYIGEIYILMNDNDQAEIQLNKAFEKAERLNDFSQLGYISSLLGSAFLSQKKYNNAESYFITALHYELLSKKRAGNRIWANIGLGLIAKEQGKEKIGEKYFSAAKLEIKYLGIKTNIDKLYIGNGSIKEQLKEYNFF